MAAWLRDCVLTYLPACLPCLSTSTTDYIPAYFQSIYLHVCSFTHLPSLLFTHLSICPPIHLSTWSPNLLVAWWLLINLSDHLIFCQSIYLFSHPSTWLHGHLSNDGHVGGHVIGQYFNVCSNNADVFSNLIFHWCFSQESNWELSYHRACINPE